MGFSASAYAGNCKPCYGTGVIKINAQQYRRCAKCNGSGNVAEPKVCSMCNGEKAIRLDEETTKKCPKCEGAGKY